MKTQNSKKKSMISDKKVSVKKASSKKQTIELAPMNITLPKTNSLTMLKPIAYAAVAILAVSLCFVLSCEAKGAGENIHEVIPPMEPIVEIEPVDLMPKRMPKHTVPLLHQEWKDYLALPNNVRHICMKDASYRKSLTMRTWKSPNPENQFIGKEYEQWITEDIPPRVLNVPGVANVRNFGGWKTEDGTKRIKRGLIIRSGEMNHKSWGGEVGKVKITFEGQKILTEDLVVRSDIDLRSESEVAGMRNSPIGEYITWIHHPWGFYSWIGGPAERREFRGIFRDLIDESNLPAVVHCGKGRDRTGTLCFILQGILGVSDEDKFKDWEVSAFWFADPGFIHEKCIEPFISWLNRTHPSSSINEGCVEYAKACGITNEQIESFRTLMLENVNQ